MRIENIQEYCSECGNNKNVILTNNDGKTAMLCLKCGSITSHLDILIYEDMPDSDTPVKSEDNLPVVFILNKNISDVSKLSDIYSVEQNYLGLVIDDETALSSLLEIIDFDQLKLLLENINENLGCIDELNSLLRNGNKEVILTQDDATKNYLVILKKENGISRDEYSKHSISDAIHNIFINDSILKEKFLTNISLEEQKSLAYKLRPLIGYIENGSDITITLSYHNGLYKIAHFDSYKNKIYWQIENTSLEDLINKAHEIHKEDYLN